jgi:hypothetical protein
LWALAHPLLLFFSTAKRNFHDRRLTNTNENLYII